MEKGNENQLKKIFKIIFIDIIAIAGLIFIFKEKTILNILNSKKENPKILKTSGNIPVPDSIKNSEIIRKGFFKNIPLNKPASISNAYELKNTVSGKTPESVIIFESEESIENNKKFYKNWSAENKWTTTENPSNPEDKKIFRAYMNKENKTINITFEETSQNTTKLTIIYKEINKKIKTNIENAFKNIKI